MKVYINDFELNSASNRVYLNENIEGLDLPNIRTSKGTRTGSHGGYIGRQLFDVRSITLQGRIFSDSVSEAIGKRRAIQSHLPLYPEVVRLRIIDEDGIAYLIACQVIDFQMPIGRFRGRSNFKLDLEATDPVIYDDTAGGALKATINKRVSGGMLLSNSSPVFGFNSYFTGGHPETTVNNPSQLVAYPTIVIVGSLNNPRLINRRTGQVLQMDEYSVAAGAVTQIDFKNRTVRLGAESDLVDGMLPDGVGGNVFGYVTTTSDWWGLLPGDNPIGFESASGNNVSSADLYWRFGHLGI